MTSPHARLRADATVDEDVASQDVTSEAADRRRKTLRHRRWDPFHLMFRESFRPLWCFHPGRGVVGGYLPKWSAGTELCGVSSVANVHTKPAARTPLELAASWLAGVCHIFLVTRRQSWDLTSMWNNRSRFNRPVLHGTRACGSVLYAAQEFVT